MFYLFNDFIGFLLTI